MTRRSALTTLGSFGALVTASRPGGAHASKAGDRANTAGATTPALRATVSATARFVPSGWLARRLALCERRLLGPGFPAYTPRFVLADLALDPTYPRLYDRFSGDISGRYLEILAVAFGRVPEGRRRLRALATAALPHQRPDGRFGDAALRFDGAAIGREHMALLWGNGRLLVGLLAAHATIATDAPPSAHARIAPDAAAAAPTPDATALLASARRLGDFLLGVRAACARPEVERRLEGQGAHGLICFTQLIEGLVMLARSTGERRYLEAAAAIAPKLPPPGVQHTHGYLSTLRGILALGEATGDPTWRTFAHERFTAFLASPDYQEATGGVLEFFGATQPGLSAADLRKLGDLDKKDAQDEGCSVADLVRLALDLHRATGDARMLEVAERGLHNHLLFNQFATGDFGHHVLFPQGFRPAAQVGMAWWCCTMHGARALWDVAQAALRLEETKQAKVVTVDLYLEGRVEGDGRSVRLASAAAPAGVDARYVLTLERGFTGPTTVRLRHPSWLAAPPRLTRAGKPLAGTPGLTGYVEVAVAPGAPLTVDLAYATRLHTRDRRTLRPEDVGTTPIEAALSHGPWLLGVHEATDPLFLRRPWAFATPHNFNRILLPARGPAGEALPVPTAARGARGPATPWLARRLPYQHGGWPERGAVTLRPIAAQTDVPSQQILAIWLHFQRDAG
jgi:hypothetical protein